MIDPAVLASTAAELAALCRAHHVRSLDLFGSAVSGPFDPQHSDLDFLVAFEDKPVPGYARTWFAFETALANLFGRNVDLISEAALENPFFRRQVMASRRRLFSA